jgi:hypothetical protein
MRERSAVSLSILLALGAGASPAGGDGPNMVTALVVAGPGFPDDAARGAKEKELQQRWKASHDALTDLDVHLYKAHGNSPTAWPADAIAKRMKAKAEWDVAHFARDYTTPKVKDLTEGVAQLRGGLSESTGYPIPLVERAEDAVIVVTVRGRSHGCVGFEIAPGGKARAPGVARTRAAFSEPYDRALAQFAWERGWPVNYGNEAIDIRFYNHFSAEEPYWRVVGCDKKGGAEQVRKFARWAEALATASDQ